VDHCFFKVGEKLGNFQNKISAQQKELKKNLGKGSHGEKELKGVNSTDQALCLAIIREFKKTM